MRMLSFTLMALVGTIVLGLPLQTYADPQLDTLLSIATQAKDNLSLTISQINNVPDEINQLYKQGSDETNQLAKAIDQQDVQSAKQHFLAAMKFFKATNDKINSLNATESNDQQRAQIAQLRGEIIKLERMEILLKTIATKNNINVDFSRFDQLIQTSQQNLDSGNVDDAKTAINDANNFLVESHHSLTSVAQERNSERAKDFTEKQIERFSKVKEINPPQPSPSTTPPIPTPPTNETTPTPPITTPIPLPQAASNVPNYVVVKQQSPEQMLAELKKLVSEGKVDEALKVIKALEAYERDKMRATEKEEQLSSSTNSTNLAINPPNNTSITTSIIPTPTIPENETGINTTSSTIQPPINPSITTHSDHEKHDLEKKRHDNAEHKGNDHQDFNSQHD